MPKKWRLKNFQPPLIIATSYFFGRRSGALGAKLEATVATSRFVLFVGMVLLVGLLFAGRLIFLQLVDFPQYFLLAHQVRTYVEWEASPRGLIFDKSGRALVHNKPVFSLVFVPAQLPKNSQQRQRQILTVIREAALDSSQIRKILKNQDFTSFEPIVLVPDLKPEVAKRLSALLPQTAAFRVRKRYQRIYEDSMAFSHILGFVSQSGLQSEGKSGLELFYNKDLSGEPGKTEITVTATGEPRGEVSETPPRPGNSLILNIDAELQEHLYQELSRQLELLKARRAAAVALDPRTGAVRALVSIPSFDNVQLSTGISQEEFQKLLHNQDGPFFNRALSGQYPPGSTIKPVIATAVLEENIIDPKKQIFVTGQISVPSVFDPDIVYVFKDWRPQGWVDLVKAIAVSSNVYFYTVGGGYGDIKGLGIKKLNQWFRKFGLGQVTGIDLPGEKKGFIPTPEWKKQTQHRTWFIGDTYNVSIGQGNLLVTPLQVAVYTAAIANGGFLMKPYILQKIESFRGKTVAEFGPTIVSRVVDDPKHLEIVREGMRQAVTTGSAQLLKQVPVPVAGKTGTAQVSGGRNHGWFTGFAPYDNPELVITVLVENGIGGTTAAVPVAQRVLQWYFSQRE